MCSDCRRKLAVTLQEIDSSKYVLLTLGVLRAVLKGLRQQRITSKDSNCLSVYNVISRLAAPQIIVVHRWQVIVYQAHRVYHLK
jgi:hypothetical protein